MKEAGGERGDLGWCLSIGSRYKGQRRVSAGVKKSVVPYVEKSTVAHSSRCMIGKWKFLVSSGLGRGFPDVPNRTGF